MKVKSPLWAGLGALALGLVTTTAQAGPSGLASAFDQSAGRGGLAEKVTWYGDRRYGHLLKRTDDAAEMAAADRDLLGPAVR